MRKIVIGLFIRFKGNGPKFTESTEWKEWNTVCIRSQNCKQDYSEWQHFHCWGIHFTCLCLLSLSFLARFCPFIRNHSCAPRPAGIKRNEDRGTEDRQRSLHCQPAIFLRSISLVVVIQLHMLELFLSGALAFISLWSGADFVSVCWRSEWRKMQWC